MKDMDIRTADGASYEGNDADGHMQFRISIPADDDGYLGRECPSCDQMFRIHVDDYEQLPDTADLYCVYCGHRTHHSEFMTRQQMDRAEQVVLDAGTQMLDQMLGDAFGRLSSSTAGSGFIQVSYESTPFSPQPLPGIDEEKLVRERRCPACNLRYAVFGEHRYCPVDGHLDALDIALDALAAEAAKLDALTALPEEARRNLREQGVLDRIQVDALANTVGIIEALAKETFRSRVSNADALTRGKGNIFQRLDDTADLFAAHLNIDIRTAPEIVWGELLRLWATRHVHVHNGGRVDQRYLRAVPTTTLTEGQRVLVTMSDVRIAVAQAIALCRALAPQDAAPGPVTSGQPPERDK